MTGSFSMLGPRGPQDISPVERAAGRELAVKLAELARKDLAIKVLRDALLEIKTHHTLQNLARGRDPGVSHTLKTATMALKRAAAYLDQPA